MSDPVLIASDHAGFGLKQALVEWMRDAGYEVQDLGTHDEASTDYPDYAHALCRTIIEGGARRGVLVCGTGIGMCMAANRHPQIRAALCTETFAARMTRLHNDANVLCLGARIIGIGVAQEVLGTFLGTDFEGGRHVRRVGKITP